MMSTTTVERSYRQIREQLISLTVDLEDKTKLCKFLKDKANRAREHLKRMEPEFEKRYQAQLEEEGWKHQEMMTKLVEDTNKILDTKKDKVANCKVLVDQLSVDERLTVAECQKLYADTEAIIERERKLFRAGYDDRLQTFLLNKAAEVKESTAKALHAEFRKAEVSHEQEMLDLDRRYKLDERQLREALKEKLATLLVDEDRFLKEETSRLSRIHAESTNNELSEMEKEHRRRKNEIEEVEEISLRALAESLRHKAEIERRKVHEELQESQDIFQDKLKHMRQRNATELAAVRSDHELQIKELRLKASRDRDELDKQLLAQLDDDSGGYDNRDDELVPSYVHTSGPTNSATNTTAEWEQERDKRLQSEIKQIQSDMVRFERDLNCSHEEKKSGVDEALAREKEELQRRQVELTDELTGLAMEREELIVLLREQSERSSRMQADLKETLREVDIYQGGIAVHRMRIKDLEGLHEAKSKDEQQTAAKHLSVLQAGCRSITDESQLAETEHKQVATLLVNDREIMLDALDRKIKADLARKDASLDALCDAVHAEDVKVKRLEKLLQRYLAPAVADR